MASRPRHPNKDIERILRAAEQQGWRVFKNRYYRILCPCPDQHMKSVHLTPSNPYYCRDLLAWLYRSTCFEEHP